MTNYKVIEMATYQKEINKWEKADREAAGNITRKLALNPYVGNKIKYDFLREKRVGGKRIYFLIYDDLKLVLVVATSGKKDQQEIINSIRGSLKKFRIEAEKISKRPF